ncbi:MAG TPA: MFS transporter [Acidimicrobiales bacterium]|nr:MFS transporter [Acidimicrobiales bacterium]
MTRAGIEDDGRGAAPAAAPDRTVVALLVSVFCGMAATAAQVTSLGKQVYDLTGRELDLGLVGLAEFAPAALLVLVTGAVADRHDRRRVASSALAAEAVVAVALSLYAGSHPTAAGPIFGLVFGFGIARAFAAPASRALLSDIVPPHRLPWLVARFSFAWQSALVAGPVLGGVLYTVDVRLPYAAAAGLLLVAAAALLVVRPLRATDAGRTSVAAAVQPASPGDALAAAGAPAVAGSPAGGTPLRAGLRDAVEGFRFIRRVPVLLGALSLDLFAVLFGGAVALLPAIATDRLGVDAAGLGWLRAAGGLGAGAVTLALTRRPLERRVGPALLLVVAAFGLFTIVLGVTRSYAVAFAAMVLLSAADAVSVFVRATLVPLVTPGDKRGRVLAVENVFIGGSNELGAFESGVAGQLLGPSGAVVLGGAATLVVAAAWGLLFPDLRRVDRFPAGTPDLSGA